jgi:hypothetical protein
MASSFNITTSDPIRTPWPCTHCQSDRAIVGPGKGPHYAKLTCADCDKFGRWLSVGKFQQLGLQGNGGQA